MGYKNQVHPQIVYEKLYSFQKEAFDNMFLYYNYYVKKKNIKSCLVALPTGSGKTAVIATLARCVTEIKNVLIISPRKAVSLQLFNEISESFFKDKIKIKGEIPKKVNYFDENFEVYEKELSSQVLVCTIQKLDYLKKSNKKIYNKLITFFSLVIFDEGHYEPAISWSDTIRNFNCPRIIFTATPFRNDFKSFDVDWNLAYTKSYDEILALLYLRKVEFIKGVAKRNDKEIIAEIFSLYTTYFGSLGREEKPKVIINCDNHSSIIKLAQIVNTYTNDFIALHEKFTPEFKMGIPETLRNNFVKKVPERPKEEKAFIWIHQYKLLEGIDDSSFQMLAIYEPLKNTRSLIQQIGRTIRNPKKVNETAYVINFTSYEYGREWDKYRVADNSKSMLNGFQATTYEKFNNVLPSSIYVDKKFRDKFEGEIFKDANKHDIDKEIKLPLKVNAFDKLKEFSLFRFCKEYIEAQLNEKDKIWYKNDRIARNVILYYYFTIKNSSFLNEKYFPEIKHDVCLVKETSKFIFFYDSSDMMPLGKDNLGVGLSVSPENLKRLFKNNNSSNFTQISLNNSNLGTREIRNHSFRAPSITDTTPFLNDFSHYVNSIYGTYLDNIDFKKKKDQKYTLKTYIGFNNGRISQNMDSYVILPEYLSWLDYIEKIISSKVNSHITFRRYASELLNIIDKYPSNILLEFFEIMNELRLTDDENEIFDWEENMPDKCLDIKKDANIFYFDLQIIDKTYRINMFFDDKRKKFILDCPALKYDLIGTSNFVDRQTTDLIRLLNEKQSFRIITESRYLYANGRFYKPSLGYGDNFDINKFQLGKTIIPIKELENIGSEKGTKNLPNNAGWETNTLFGLISTCGNKSELKKYFDEPELLICDDMGTEIADFILVNKNKLVLIHAKGLGNDSSKKGRKYSASAISDVCAQAIKNIHYVSMFDNSRPSNLNRWDSPWKYSYKNKKYNINIDMKVNSRIRIDRNKIMDINKMWGKIEELKYDSNYDKEVWLVLGKLFSYKSFIKELSKRKSTAPEAIQATLLLTNLLASLGSMGVKLKIFCSN